MNINFKFLNILKKNDAKELKKFLESFDKEKIKNLIFLHLVSFFFF
jgi:hypothetical protein